MESDERLRDSLILLGMAPPDSHAISYVMGEVGIATRLCTAGRLSQEVRAGVGAIVVAEESISESCFQVLSELIQGQPVWSDIPLIILTQKRDGDDRRGTKKHRLSFRNASFLERPMKAATLLQTIKFTLRAREKQYRLRDQMIEREWILAASVSNERRLAAVLDNTRMAVFIMDDQQRCTFMNAAAERLTGFSLVETQGKSLHETLHHTYPDGRPYPLRECRIDSAFPDNNQTEGEEVFIHKDGHFYPVAFTASPIRMENVIVGTVIEVRDISREKADIERLKMLLDELNHRVKNMLVNAQSIFVQTLEGETISVDAKEGVMSRLMALSRSHDLLTERNWGSASLWDIAHRALAPFGATEAASGRFFITGDNYFLPPQSVLAVSMGLHELATNALKYGALTIKGGSVGVSWGPSPGGILRLRWVERGGPRVADPVRSGFGRRLIERGLAHELGSETHIHFHRDGLICEIDIPMAMTMGSEERIIH